MSAASQPTIQVGDTIPEAIFGYVPYSPELADPAACGLPAKVKTADWANKKVVLFGLPGSFTRTCSANHVPPFIQHHADFVKKGVDVVACIASNDIFVQSAWGRVLNVEDKILMISDDFNLTWLKAAGLTADYSAGGLGIRSCRFAMVLDNLRVTYLGIESAPGVSVSGAEAVLAVLE